MQNFHSHSQGNLLFFNLKRKCVYCLFCFLFFVYKYCAYHDQIVLNYNMLSSCKGPSNFDKNHFKSCKTLTFKNESHLFYKHAYFTTPHAWPNCTEWEFRWKVYLQITKSLAKLSRLKMNVAYFKNMSIWNFLRLSTFYNSKNIL